MLKDGDIILCDQYGSSLPFVQAVASSAAVKKQLKILCYFSRKRIQNYKQKIRHEIEYLFIIRKEITGKYKFKKADKYHRYNEIQNNNLMILISFPTHP